MDLLTLRAVCAEYRKRQPLGWHYANSNVQAQTLALALDYARQLVVSNKEDTRQSAVACLSDLLETINSGV